MARPRPEKPEKKPDSVRSTEPRLLPMQLRIGDRLIDETGEWEIVGRPYMTAGGKTAHVRIKLLEGDSTEIRTWGAHERISVKR